MLPTGFGEIAEQLRRSTVQIHSAGGGGSGIVWSTGGLVVTNSHVVPLNVAGVTLWDGRKLHGKVELRDEMRDLVKIRVAAGGLPAIRVRDSSTLRPGELVVAVGHPLGFIGAVTTGVIHSAGRFAGAPGREWIQAGIGLAPGNSGGPLADAGGLLIGINTMVASGIGLAIPSNSAQRFVQRTGSTPMLGVTVRPVNSAHGYGWMILAIEPGSAAERASLLPGDVLLRADEQPVHFDEGFSEALARGKVVLQFIRPGSAHLREVAAVIQAVRTEAA